MNKIFLKGRLETGSACQKNDEFVMHQLIPSCKNRHTVSLNLLQSKIEG